MLELGTASAKGIQVDRKRADRGFRSTRRARGAREDGKHSRPNRK